MLTPMLSFFYVILYCFLFKDIRKNKNKKTAKQLIEPFGGDISMVEMTGFEPATSASRK